MRANTWMCVFSMCIHTYTCTDIHTYIMYTYIHIHTYKYTQTHTHHTHYTCITLYKQHTHASSLSPYPPIYTPSQHTYTQSHSWFPLGIPTLFTSMQVSQAHHSSLIKWEVTDFFLSCLSQRERKLHQPLLGARTVMVHMCSVVEFSLSEPPFFSVCFDTRSLSFCSPDLSRTCNPPTSTSWVLILSGFLTLWMGTRCLRTLDGWSASSRLWLSPIGGM